MNIEAYIPNVAAWLGVQPATVLLFLGIIVSIANIVGRLIPDTATGWRAGVRKVAKVVGMFIPNRIADGISVNDIAKAVVTERVPEVTAQLESGEQTMLNDQVDKKVD